MKGLLSIALVSMVLLLSACAVGSDVAPYNQAEMPDYTLAPGDKVHLVVYGDDTVTGDYMIDKRGMITVPLIDEIEAAGLTKKQLQDNITNNLTKSGYLKNPHVTVDLTALQPFYILGEVNNPGSYDYQPSLDVFKAIALAGGYTPRAVKDNVIITRDGPKGKIRINATEDAPVLPGDSIKVKQRFF